MRRSPLGLSFSVVFIFTMEHMTPLLSNKMNGSTKFLFDAIALVYTGYATGIQRIERDTWLIKDNKKYEKQGKNWFLIGVLIPFCVRNAYLRF